jgi:plastocyanin
MGGRFVTGALVHHAILEKGALRSPIAGTPTLARADLVTVRIESFRFDAEKLSVPAGTTVTWTNFDNSPHQVSVAGMPLRTGILLKGQSGSITFTEPGTYEYRCKPHSSMKGTIGVR